MTRLLMHGGGKQISPARHALTLLNLLFWARVMCAAVKPSAPGLKIYLSTTRGPTVGHQKQACLAQPISAPLQQDFRLAAVVTSLAVFTPMPLHHNCMTAMNLIRAPIVGPLNPA